MIWDTNINCHTLSFLSLMNDDISIYFKYLYVRLLLIAVFSFLSKSSRMFRVLSTYRTLTFPDFGPSGSPSLTSSSLIFADFFFPMLMFCYLFYKVIAYNCVLFLLFQIIWQLFLRYNLQYWALTFHKAIFGFQWCKLSSLCRFSYLILPCSCRQWWWNPVPVSSKKWSCNHTNWFWQYNQCHCEVGWEVVMFECVLIYIMPISK